MLKTCSAAVRPDQHRSGTTCGRIQANRRGGTTVPFRTDRGPCPSSNKAAFGYALASGCWPAFIQRGSIGAPARRRPA